MLSLRGASSMIAVRVEAGPGKPARENIKRSLGCALGRDCYAQKDQLDLGPVEDLAEYSGEDFRVSFSVIYGGRFFGGPTMLTTTTEEDWTIVLKLFKASRSRRGDKGRGDRKFLEDPVLFRGSQHHVAGDLQKGGRTGGTIADWSVWQASDLGCGGGAGRRICKKAGGRGAWSSAFSGGGYCGAGGGWCVVRDGGLIVRRACGRERKRDGARVAKTGWM